ncbi:MAG: hypothetical protein QOJ02_455 [Acidobacteriota bacterium]|jgi:hypothetical protein|nr:hypothetical protein [Acidobacteriota bacterium]
MKRCPSCQFTYPDTQGFCANDGTQLINDDAPSDIAKAIVAPPQQSSSGNVPLTQVFSPNPAYDNQQLPPAYAPQQQQQQWQTSYPPPYQQQQYGTPGQSRKMLYIGIAAVVVLTGVGLLLWFLPSSGKSLGTYKGSLNAFTPEKVGAYERKNAGTLDEMGMKGTDRDNPKLYFGYDDARIAEYESSGKHLVLAVANFSSTEKAKDALKKFKTEMHGPNSSLKEEGTSKRGGDRLVYAIRSERPSSTTEDASIIVLWTNGSTVFAAGPTIVLEPRRETESNMPKSSDVLDFEKSYPY